MAFPAPALGRLDPPKDPLDRDVVWFTLSRAATALEAVSVVQPDGGIPTLSYDSPAIIDGGYAAEVWFSGGVAGIDYTVLLQILLQDGSRLYRRVILPVRSR